MFYWLLYIDAHFPYYHNVYLLVILSDFNAHYCNDFFNIENADKVSTLTCESQLYEIPYRPFNTYSSDLLLDELF